MFELLDHLNSLLLLVGLNLLCLLPSVFRVLIIEVFVVSNVDVLCVEEPDDAVVILEELGLHL